MESQIRTEVERMSRGSLDLAIFRSVDRSDESYMYDPSNEREVVLSRVNRYAIIYADVDMSGVTPMSFALIHQW